MADDGQPVPLMLFRNEAYQENDKHVTPLETKLLSVDNFRLPFGKSLDGEFENAKIQSKEDYNSYNNYHQGKDECTYIKSEKEDETCVANLDDHEELSSVERQGQTEDYYIHGPISNEMTQDSQSYEISEMCSDSDVDVETIPHSTHSIEVNDSDVDIETIPDKSHSIVHCNSQNLKRVRRHVNGRKYDRHKEIDEEPYTASYNGFNISDKTDDFHNYSMQVFPLITSSMESDSVSVHTFKGESIDRISNRSYERRQLSKKQNTLNERERNRRYKITILLQDLRDNVPNVALNMKASQVAILDEAVSYIGELKKLQQNQDDMLRIELHRKKSLKLKLMQVQSYSKRKRK